MVPSVLNGELSMAKKVVKQAPHLRIRLDPKLIARLEKAREINGNTLTGEIVARLEESFSTEDKLALQKESLRESFRAIEVDMNERFGRQAAEHEDLLGRINQYAGIDLLIQFLLGNNPQPKQTLHSLLVLVARKPWLAQELDAAIKAIEEKAK
jgi:hypothetical protein